MSAKGLTTIRRPVFVLALVGLGAIVFGSQLSASAGAAPADADLQIEIGALTTQVPGTNAVQTPNGKLWIVTAHLLDEAFSRRMTLQPGPRYEASMREATVNLSSRSRA